ncbi:hypothetical protein ES703_68960 [subsurface metagenome]
MKKSNTVLLSALGAVLIILLAFILFLGFTLKGMVAEKDLFVKYLLGGSSCNLKKSAADEGKDFQPAGITVF